jgi:spore germination cell wall hydrolase CwlJ-like protein
MLAEAIVCLALNVYYESRGEPWTGQYAVALVTLNRVKSERFPDNVCDVVKEARYKGKHRCQFSWYCDGKSDTPQDSYQYAYAQMVAADVLRGEVDDFTLGSTHYHASHVNPYWASKLEYTGQTGSHLFYKENYHD